ncbi:MAG TPA: L-threonylcarbamoyladenylate synthase [Bacteroidales bacterium]|nr:threonylcarbamoyl-AMP synthase [Bacteroidales bacterium]HOU95173.1 L-threonylcarbamoyladenylate synthase [Bacteroidales bacterium]HQG35940.1 L-threonylcarbamoyladenylate synthase [Bacteroidales bacterium]HQG53653.1 L-threonylcarbamoyladenylate synthase [Bacteroidales bacterium]HQJ21375.1 L-threonylcarbamoyladenylate synthase [Bacteroidales bacterium]
MKFQEHDISNALKTLKRGGVLLYPTDTVWGLGCDAENASAIEKIFMIKKRHESKSMIILVNSIEMLSEYVSGIPSNAIDIIKHTRRPVTIVYNNVRKFPAGLLSKDGSIGIRVTRDEFCRELIRKFGNPIVSTSANISGRPTPANFFEIEEEIIRSADYVAEYRREEFKKHKPSRIIKVETDGSITVIRD